MRTCPSCHEVASDDARFCASCGARLPETSLDESERRLVTIVFADLVGSTKLTTSIDPEAVREASRGWFARVRSEVEKHGGRVEKFAGDGVMAVFGVPQLHDDDAARAARAALDIVDTTERYAATLPERVGAGLSVRVGLESGECVLSLGAGDQFIATGIAVNTAARLQGLAQPNSVIVGPSASRLLDGWADLGVRSSVSLKGMDFNIDAAELVAVHSQRPDRPGRHSLPFAGRSGDLGLLRAVAQQAQSTRSSHVIALIGPAGIGKSRLAHQAVLGLDALVLEGRCPSYGDATGLYPVAQIVNDLAGFVSRQPTIDELRTALYAKLRSSTRVDDLVDVLSRLDDVYGVTPPTIDDVIWAMHEMITVLGRERPLVVLVEDIHWASERLIRVISRVASEVRDASLLVIFTARPEVADGNAAWVNATSNSHTINLSPLSDNDVRWLIEQSYPDVDPDDVERVVGSAEGNPLFVSMLLQDSGGDFDDDIPLGVVALANARLHQLPEAERLLLGRASVLGRVFYPRGIAYLGGDALGDVSELLLALKEKRLIHESPTDLVDEPSMAFDHALIQEAAYRQLPKALRIDLHVLAAAWLQTVSLHPTTYQAIAHHRRLAMNLAVELDLPQPQVNELREAAAQAAFDAAHSLDATNSGAIIDYLNEAAELTSDLRLHCLALHDLMLSNFLYIEPSRVHEVVGVTRAQDREDLAMLLRAALLYHQAGASGATWGDFRAAASRAVVLARETGDNELLVRALICLAQADQQLAPTAAVEAARSARMHLEASDNLLASTIAILTLGVAANLDASFESVQQVVNSVFTTSSGFRLEHRSLSVLARFAALADRSEDVDVLMARHREIAPYLRAQDISTNIGFMLAPALASLERHEEAIGLWQESLPIFEEVFGHDVIASVWPEVALSYMALDKWDDARPLCDDSIRTRAADDDLGQAQWLVARCRLAAHDGDIDLVNALRPEAEKWIDAMTGGWATSRLRLELAAALAAVGQLDLAKVLALKSREAALHVGAFALVRRANAVLAMR